MDFRRHSQPPYGPPSSLGLARDPPRLYEPPPPPPSFLTPSPAQPAYDSPARRDGDVARPPPPPMFSASLYASRDRDLSRSPYAPLRPDPAIAPLDARVKEGGLFYRDGKALSFFPVCRQQ